LNEMEGALGINRERPLYEQVHHIFLDVNPNAK
jgi:hypothetical protein